MRENDLNQRKRRRFSRTTDSDHGCLVFPFVARDLVASGPDQLWVADITYVAIASGFAYLSIVLGAWSRRVVGHTLARDLEARHSVAALERAIVLRRPPPGCVFHSDRRAQTGLNWSSQRLDRGGCDVYPKAAFGSIRARRIAVSGSAASGVA